MWRRKPWLRPTVDSLGEGGQAPIFRVIDLEATTGHCQTIRDLINDPRRRFALLKEPPIWFQVCVSLDTIEDCELAFAEFKPAMPASLGGRYLFVHGLLQCLFIQQDALSHLASALAIAETYTKNPRLVEIREIRNDVTGHPTRRDRRGRKLSFHSISRSSIGSSDLQVLSDYEDGSTQIRDIDLTNLIEDQRSFAAVLLQHVVEAMEAADAAHRKEFKMVRLIDLFAPTQHALEQIHEGISKPGFASMGKWGIDQLRLVRSSLANALVERGTGVEAYEGLKDHYDRLEYPLNQLQAYFEKLADGEIRVPEMAEIVASYVGNEFASLRGVAKELDDDYAR